MKCTDLTSGEANLETSTPPGTDKMAGKSPCSNKPYPEVLVVEDDVELASALSRYLHGAHFLVTSVIDGSEALQLVLDSPDTYDAVVLDVMLPGLDGREVCRQIRAAGCWVPILMTTALGELDDRITGLQLGADDYMVKPFSLEELSLRISALMRRKESIWLSVLEVSNLRINLHTRQGWKDGKEIRLSHREFQLLELFMRHAGLVLSRNTIRSSVWGTSSNKEVSNNLIDKHIARLRRKIDSPTSNGTIETLSRIGYRLRITENT